MIDTKIVRENILSLAFCGKLNEQERSDISAKELLLSISGGKKIDIIGITPFDIPDNWCWAKLEDVYVINPKVDASPEDDAAFIPMENISAGYSDLFSFEVQTWEKASKNHTKFADGDVAFAKISPCFENRKSFIAHGLPNGIGGGTTELIVLRQPLMNARFTYYLLLDRRFINTGSESYRGIVGQQRVKSEVIKRYPIPIPPLEEQNRIVEKIDEAFAILDRIDELQREYSDNAEMLKEKIIEAGIFGELSEHIKADTDVKTFFSEKRIKMSNETLSVEIPAYWGKAKLSHVCEVETGNSIPEAIKKEKYAGRQEGYPYIGTKDVSFGHSIDYENGVRIPFEETGFEVAKSGSALLCIEGGSAGRKIAITNQSVCYGNKLCRFYTEMINPRFVYYFLQTETFKKVFKDKLTGLIGGVSISTLRKVIIPIPPIEEQARIVEKLDSILPLCQ